MTCDEIRDVLSEYLLGSLDDIPQAQVDRHLRGCGACRRELSALSDGISTLALATHDEPPPNDLRDEVLSALSQEWATPDGRDAIAATSGRPPGRRPWLFASAAAVIAVVALTWGGVVQQQASRAHGKAAEYDHFLDTLGGEGVRVGTLSSATEAPMEGSLVVYDSAEGQSWVLVLVRAPGQQGPFRATLATPSGAPIALRPITLGPDGDGSTWLVTGKDLHAYDQVSVADASGEPVASGSVSES